MDYPRCPAVTVIVTNHNGKHHLDSFFRSVQGIDYPKERIETIMVDNASSDGSQEFVRRNFPWVKLHTSQVDLKFPGANNLAAHYAKGDYLLFLNNDTVVDRGLVTEMLKGFGNPAVGGVGAKVLLWDETNPAYGQDNRISTSWLKVNHSTGMPLNFVDERPKAEIDYLPGCAMMVKREVFGRLGGFDPAYFAYFEETDLCARMIRAGYKLLYLPDAVIWHKVMGSTRTKGAKEGITDFNSKMMERNRLRFVLKNFDAAMLPWFVLSYAAELAFRTLDASALKIMMSARYWLDRQGWKVHAYLEADYWRRIKFMWLGAGWNILHLPGTLLARRRDLGRIAKPLSYNKSLPLRDLPEEGRGIKRGEASVVVIPSISWFFPLHQRVHHFAGLFAKSGCDVLYLEPERHRKNHFARQGLEVWYPVAGASIFQLATAAKLSVAFGWSMAMLSGMLNGLGLMDHWHRFRRNIESKAFRDQYREKFAEYSHAKRKIAFFQTPYQTDYIPLLRKLGYSIAYDMVDEVSEFKESPAYFREKEGYLLDNADLVVTTAKKLYERAKGHNRNAVLVPNGVEYGHFARARARLQRPADMPRPGKPIVGYYGAIWTWFNMDALEYAARERPGWDFVLIGTLHPSLKRRIARLGNVHYLGEKKYAELPKYLSNFDVAVIPFRKEKLTESVNPVKVYEYLAGGKPVVVTNLPELRGFPCVATADGNDAFVAAIGKALKSRPDLKKIDAFLKGKTWEARFSAVAKKLGMPGPLREQAGS